ncbi:MAG: ATP-binding protein [Pseudomonadota bacterium]|nr:ATP-binding protein [Pseudomonadota bacterium]
MLIEFSVSNFRSLADKQTLSLVAGSGKEHRETHVFEPDAPGMLALLRAAVIYGPNASGKSNLLLALSAMQQIVENSASGNQADDEIDVDPFAFATEPNGAATEFEVLFVEGGVRYQYGFSTTRTRIESEWLFAFPEGRSQRWFERNVNPPEGEQEWYFGPKFAGNKKVWQESTRPNALFLSTAIQLNSDSLKPVFQWFSHRLKMIEPYARISPSFSTRKCEEDAEWNKKIIEFLNKADLGISAIQVEERKMADVPFPPDMPEPVRKYLNSQVSGRVLSDVKLSHRSANGAEARFSLHEESGGTQKAFALAGPWLDVLANGYVLVIDELDTSLHPALLRHLLEMFHDPRINTKGAQLVFSTHDVTSLDFDLLRRDQIWFVEKDRELRSHLYPLSDFSPRKGENLERGYLQGRYGALPFIGGPDL